MSTVTPDEDHELLGRVVAGKLRIVEHLGSGSMGRVYRAHHLSLDKDVAIKVLRESAVPDPNRSKRFAREARAASRLNHPNSVAVLDFGEDGDDKLLYIAMEFLEGEDLQAIIDRGQTLSVDRICHVMIQVLAALAAAHDAGIIHRDMKPSNIVLVKQRNDEGLIAEVVKVCDFGVAKFVSGNRDTLDGGKAAQRVVGTPLYMSPEQAVGDTLDPRTDVYSCGVIMYEMLTGQPPFTAETPMGVLMKHVSEPVTPPSELVRDVPVELQAVILWALEKDRERRPSTARELRTALRAFLAGQAGTISALARYGVESIPDASPWSGPTPYWQLDMPAPPRSGPSGILAAPPPPPPRPEETRPSSRPHAELVADLDIDASPPAAPTRAQPRAAPPQGAQVPSALLDAPWEERSEIFSDQSYFQVKARSRDRLTMDPEDAGLDAPPPRSLSRGVAESDTVNAPAARDRMATYLWERFGMSPHRRVPDDGFWLRDAEDREVGPCAWSEVTRALRMEASRGEVGEVSVSSDRRNWIAAERFVQLTGVEAILETEDALPDSSPFAGELGARSVASVFAEVTRRAVTGRVLFRVESDRRRARFDIHLDGGKPTFVLTNEPHLQLPDLLVTKGVLSEDRLPAYIRAVLARATTLEEAVARDQELDVAQYRAAVMKERLRHLIHWSSGQFAVDDAARPASRRAFAVSLLSLLPDLVYRTLSSEFLEGRIGPLLENAPRPAANAKTRLVAMGLTRSQRGVAERLLASDRLSAVVPNEGRTRKAYTTMAYVLLEAGLLEV